MDPLSIAGVAGVAASAIASITIFRTLKTLFPRLRRDDKTSISFGIERLKDEPENPVADICFVHGLNGDPVSTWSSTQSDGRDKFWWPEALQKLTNARILLYRYSTVAPTAEYLARRTLYHQAEHLVECLANARENHPRRPLIFVAHSLGGIVVKSGLILSSQSLEESCRTRAIVLSVAGIIFLGTPHKLHGHLSSSPKSVLQIIAKVNGLNQKILKHLDDESRTLQSYLEQFEALSTDIPMISFYESRGTGSFGLIVQPSTAISSTEYHRLDSDHAGLAKFHSPNDTGYVIAASTIEQLCQEATSLVEERWGKYEQSKELNKNRNKDKRLECFLVPSRLPPQSSRFTGRAYALKWIEDSFLEKCPPDCPDNCHTIVLLGLGGIGKTQIALAFAHRFRDRFSSVFWIPCQTRSTIEHEFLEIARTLRPPFFESGNEGSAKQVAYSVLEWLKSGYNADWLLIFDNVDLSTMPDVIELIPSTTCVHGHTIITSRTPLNLPFAKTYNVHPLQVEESSALLKTYLGPSHAYNSDLEKVSEFLNGHPLALSMAASFMRETKLSPREYVEVYYKRRANLLSEYSLGNQNIDMIIAKSIERIRTLPAKLLFSMCCILSLDAIPLWIFEEGSTPFSSKRVLRESISILESFSLIFKHPFETHIQVHSLVRDNGRRTLPASLQSDARRELCETASYVAVALNQNMARFLRPASDGTPNFEKELVELIGDALSIILSYRTSSLEWDINLEELGKVCQARNRFSEAIKFYELYLEKNKDSEISTLRARLRLTLTWRHTGKRLETGVNSKDKSLGAQFQKAVEAAPDDESLEDLKSLNREQDDPEQELEVLRMIIEAQEKFSGPMNPSTLESIQEISHQLVEQGFLVEAEARLRRILMSYHKLYGAHHPSTIYAAEHLASVCASLGKLEEAEAIYKDTIQDYETCLGRDHPSTQRCLAQLAFTYYLQRRYEDAEPLFADAIDTLNRVVGPDHPDVLRIKHNYALDLMRLGRIQKSQELLENTLRRMEAHPETHSMNARRRTAIQLFQEIEGDSTIREGDRLWKVGRHLKDKYDLESNSKMDFS